jgi:PAS domain-containing protein
MKKNIDKQTSFMKMRRQAEERLRNKAGDVSGKVLDDSQKLIHELEVHQIELEMQNDELRRTQRKLLESRDKYHELYDFAPVGYFTLDDRALIRQVNITGTDLLGFQRNKLINTKFSRLISPDFQDGFYFHCKQIFESGTKQTCDLKIIKQDLAVKDETTGSSQFRTAVTDITEKVLAKKLLQESEEKFRLMFNQMVSASALFEVIYNKKGNPEDYRYLEVNQAFEHNTAKKKVR